MKSTRVLIVVSLSLALASPVASQAPDDRLIVPGERIGGFALTMSPADVTGILGPSTQLTPARFGDQSLQTDLTLYIWDVVPLAVIARDDKVALAIGIRRSQEYQTAQGIKYLAKPEAVQGAYGPPTRQVRWGRRAEEQVLVYDSLGVAFFLVEEGIVGSILVFKRQGASAIWKP